jgi:predicted lipid-binding transport protein (Tim44 family)
MKRSSLHGRAFRRAALPVIFCAGLLFACLLHLFPAAEARVGGGQSYSSRSSSRSSSGSRSSSSSSSSRSSGGGSSSSGGGGDFIAPLFYFLFRNPAISVPLVVVIAFLYLRSYKNEPDDYSSRDPEAFAWDKPAINTGAQVAARLAELRKYDPNFSEIIFNDFIYTLYARVQEARPTAALDQFSSYLDKSVIRKMRLLNGADLRDIKGVIIGATHIESVSNPAQQTVSITIEFEANYTEVSGAERGPQREETWYMREEWTFTRSRDVLSRPPEQTAALHCPKCGGGLEKKPDGSCAYCGAIIATGSFDWFVTDLHVSDRVAQGPLLTVDVPEEGTDSPTRYQFGFDTARRELTARDPGFSWPQLEARMRYIFMELQQAWTEMRWERARPFETDNVFQTHLYWMTEYQRQRLRNVLENVQISKVVPVRTTSDAFYDAITARIFAAMIDYTVDAAGNAVSGNRRAPRSFTEYWTFIRRRGGKTSGKQNDQCPNCGAQLKINMAGICEYCGGKITSGEFDWVLSRIEQDESYQPDA